MILTLKNARITINGRDKHLGCFKDVLLAAAFAATYRAIYMDGAKR